ncbi:hypothetical protein [Hirschia baltica]|uniref:Lipoprotein n=1 Tax=Hirschia baltica (strain ATCC 49814 / DSM 5838 / IFAM 1418) TaxID=582402 RepID=C6XJ58_HIRBI|nr:hypothetical protein [Hirschia baltica]ACT59153.1 hypothetical protein Hbal_1464 [Hirschia baltica ATCC 49814]
MRKSIAKIGLMSFLVLVGGCASTASKKIEPPAQTQVENDFDEFYELGELPRQTLDIGDCGLFLFASRPEPRFVFFAEAAKGTAKVILNGEETILIRTKTEGDVVDLHYTEQVFQSPLNNVEMKVTINEASPSEGGSQITKASIRLNSTDGWKMVIPVGGATSCEGQ